MSAHKLEFSGALDCPGMRHKSSMTCFGISGACQNFHTFKTQCVFLTYTKSSEDETFFPTYYDAKQVRIRQEKNLLTCFPLSYQLISAS